MVTRSQGRRRAHARGAGAAVGALAAVVSLLAVSACGTATAAGPPDAAVDPGGHIIGLSPSPTLAATSIAPIPGPEHATLVVIARAGRLDVGLDVIRTPTPAGLVDLTTWVRVERVISGSATVGQQLRIFQMVRQGVQMQAASAPVPVGVLPRLMSGRVYELWLRPLTLNEKSIAGTWMVLREQPVTTS